MTRYELEEWLKTTETPPAEPKPKDDPAWLTWTKIALAVFAPLPVLLLVFSGEPNGGGVFTAFVAWGVLLLLGIVLLMAKGAKS